MTFQELNLDKRILQALHVMNFSRLTEIQKKALPVVLSGKDVVVQSMTGSGKTAVFGIPIAQAVEKIEEVQALIVVPTRELAEQITEHLKKMGKFVGLNVCKVYGGVSMEPQVSGLRKAQVVVGTPGRILDHLRRGTADFSRVRILVLDEADRMLDMGFIDDVEKIIRSTPRDRQTILCAATMPDKIYYLTKKYMRDPIKVAAKKFVPEEKLKQYYIDSPEREKIQMLIKIIDREKPKLAMVFCATRHMSDIVANHLYRSKIEARAIHGGMSQSSRNEVLEGFHRGRPHILVATDVAARGLDIKGVTHIFNFDVPNGPDDYTHRIGRTARIGHEGKAITLLSKSEHQIFRKIVEYNKGIEKYKL